MSGLVIPDTARRSPSRARSSPWAPALVRSRAASCIPVDVAVGDVVLYSKYGGTEVTVDGEDLLVLSSRDVLAKVAGKKK